MNESSGGAVLLRLTSMSSPLDVRSTLRMSEFHQGLGLSISRDPPLTRVRRCSPHASKGRWKRSALELNQIDEDHLVGAGGDPAHHLVARARVDLDLAARRRGALEDRVLDLLGVDPR